MRSGLLALALAVLAAGLAAPACALPNFSSLREQRRAERAAKEKREKRAKKEAKKKKKKRKEQSYARRYYSPSSRGGLPTPGHRVAGTGRVLSDEQAQRLERSKVAPKAGERLAKRLGRYRGPAAGGVDARDVTRMTKAERLAAQRRPSADFPKSLRKNAPAPPAPELASVPGAGLFDKLGQILAGRWGRQGAPTVAAVKARSAEHGLNPFMVAAIADKENSGLPTGTSKARSPALGAMQVKRGTAADVGVHGDLQNPMVGVDAGARYLKRLLARFHDTTTALAHYYSGEYSKKANYGYARDVLRRYDEIKKAAKATDI